MLKVAVIGGGSTYTPELFQGFLQRQDEFTLDELWLMDTDRKRLKIVGNFVKKIAKAHGAHFKIVLSLNNDQPSKTLIMLSPKSGWERWTLARGMNI